MLGKETLVPQKPDWVARSDAGSIELTPVELGMLIEICHYLFEFLRLRKAIAVLHSQHLEGNAPDLIRLCLIQVVFEASLASAS